MKRTTLVAVTAAALVLLAGCSSTTEDGVSLRSEPVGPSAAPAESVAPLTAEAPASTPTAAPDEAAFVAEVRDTLRAKNVIPNATDLQLIQAGQRACELKASGTPAEEMTVIDGEEPIHGYYLDSIKIYDAAQLFLC